jgi:hypothetical protein
MRLLLSAVAITLLSACSADRTAGPPAAGTISADGVVRFVALEGGFFSLESADAKYDPTNLPAAFRQDGLPVHFVGNVRTDLGSVHLYGQILELTNIVRR